jgi:DNA-binding HxlR family transcriptional regulator
VGDKWTPLIVRDLASGSRRFVELQRGLPGISAEVLRVRLNRMVADGILKRTRFRERPPRVEYKLTDSGRGLLAVLGELARWGYTWAWSPPRATEAVDLGAIFRLVPALVRPPGCTGVIELAVDDAEKSFSYACALASGTATVEARSVANPDARVSGSLAAWIRALSPGGDPAALEITGSHELVDALLASLCPSYPVAAMAGRRPNQ